MKRVSSALAALFWGVVLAGGAVGQEALAIGEVALGEIVDGDAVVSTPVLEAGYRKAPTVARAYSFVAPETGPYTIELRSWDFDAYLVLRDAQGNVLAEDDDGLLGTHSRIVAPELGEGEPYLVQASALHGGRGGFELVFLRGLPPELSPARRTAAELADWERRLERQEAKRGEASPEVAETLNSMGLAYYRASRFELARQSWERSLSIRERALGPEHPDTLVSVSNLAGLLKILGDLEAARPLMERALEARERVLGPDHPQTAVSLNHLAELLRAKGELDAALPLYERAIAIVERTHGPGHPDLATKLNNLALLQRERGDHAAARATLERSLTIYEETSGRDHPDTSIALNSLAALLYSQGDLDGARLLFERAIAIRDAALGPDDWSTGTMLHNLASLLRVQGDLDGAARALERSVRIHEAHLGEHHRLTALALDNLGLLRVAKGDLRGAARAHERALDAIERVQGPDHPETASLTNNLGEVRRRQADYEGARTLFERAVGIVAKASGREHPSVATYLNNLAEVERSLGEYEEAQAHYAEALRTFEQSLDPRDPRIAHVLTNLALLSHDRGGAVSTREHLERALAIYESSMGPEHLMTLNALNNLAGFVQGQGDLVAARPLLERVVELSVRVLGPEHLGTTSYSINLGNLLLAQGELQEAQALFEDALAIRQAALGEKHPDVADALAGLATLSLSLRRIDQARGLHARALAIREEALGPAHPETASSLHSLATLDDIQGRFESALALYERAIAIREEVLGPWHPHTSEALFNQAFLLLGMGQTARAWDVLAHSLAARRDHVQTQLATMSEGERYPYLARLFLDVELQISLARLLDDPEARLAAYESWMHWKGRVARLLMVSREQWASRVGEQERAVLEELWRCQAELARLAFGVGIVEDADRERRLSEAREERARLERELQRSLQPARDEPLRFAQVQRALEPGSVVLDFARHRLYRPERSDHPERADRPERSDPERGGSTPRGYPTERGGSTPRGDPTSGRQAASQGRGGWQHRFTVWITRWDRDEPIELDLGSAEELGLELAVAGFVGELRGSRGVTPVRAGLQPPGPLLRTLLWDPIAPYLEGAERVFVSPDGALGTLPFEVLPLADGAFAIERYAFVYVQDLNALVSREEAPGPELGVGSLLSVGGVDFSGRVPGLEGHGHALPLEASSLRGAFDTRWSPLPATQHESEAVHDLHAATFGTERERLWLTGVQPSEARLKRELPNYSVLHLATHGFFQPEGTASVWESARDEAGRREGRLSDEAAHLVGKHPGLLSGLVCAGANRRGAQGDDGYLTAEEVGWLDLSQAELVVMSACETGLGRARSAEGLIGLRRAFQIAGAQTVISSLWKVEDESTAELMQGFYENLFLEGMGRHEALRTAQLAMLQRNRMEHGEALPSTWGAFVLSGEWR